MKRKPRPIRVTEVLDFVNSKWKEYWWRKVGFEAADKISKESAEFGTAVHKIVENWLKEIDDPIPRSLETREAAQVIIDWLEDKNIHPMHVEETLEDEDLNLVGHVDLIAEIDGKHYVIDWKTSNKHRTEVPLQKAAYAQMANKKFGLSISTGITVRYDKDTKTLDPKEHNDLIEKYWPRFLSCLDTFKFFNPSQDK